MKGTKMSAIVVIALGLMVCTAKVANAVPPMGTAFTYQGRLIDANGPADGLYDFEFKLWMDPCEIVYPPQVGDTLTMNDLDVINGYFTVELDFNSPFAFNGYARWLEISVRPGDCNDVNDYVTLTPRQEVTPTPYALQTRGIFVDDRMNIGMGTTNPKGKLHVDGGKAGVGVDGTDITLKAQEGGDGQSLAHSGRPGGDIILLPGEGGETPGMGWPGPAGKVGIGTAAPLATLDVRGNIQVDQKIQAYDSGGLELATDEGTTRIFVADDGKVGIGTNTPRASLEVTNTGSSHAVWASTSDIPVYAHRIATTGTWPAVAGDCNSEASSASGVRGRILSTNPGSLGAGVYGYNYGTGSSGVGVRGHHVGSGTGIYGRCDDGKGVYGYSANGYAGYFTGGKNYFQGNVGIGTTSPSGVLYTSSKNLEIQGTAPSIVLDDTDGTAQNDFEIVNGGDKVSFRDATAGVDVMALELSGTRNTIVRALEITGGSDLSERFEVGDEDEQVKPGMVVCIDPENPGDLVVSKTTYDRTVAGIVSGAGGVKTGMLMGQKGTEADGEHPVALSGRVYCWADASKTSIEPGDLLTTSDTPGHAMKVADYNKSQGATLGKAMTSLKEGKGLVLVLVSLQ